MTNPLDIRPSAQIFRDWIRNLELDPYFLGGGLRPDPNALRPFMTERWSFLHGVSEYYPVVLRESVIVHRLSFAMRRFVRRLRALVDRRQLDRLVYSIITAINERSLKHFYESRRYLR